VRRKTPAFAPAFFFAAPGDGPGNLNARSRKMASLYIVA
jgi:hypothetical protein